MLNFYAFLCVGRWEHVKRRPNCPFIARGDPGLPTKSFELLMSGAKDDSAALKDITNKPVTQLSDIYSEPRDSLMAKALRQSHHAGKPTSPMPHAENKENLATFKMPSVYQKPRETTITTKKPAVNEVNIPEHLKSWVTPADLDLTLRDFLELSVKRYKEAFQASLPTNPE